MKLSVRMSIAAALLLALQSGAAAQTMRFATSVGNFDMVLNPTNDPNLQPLVDNIVAYIGLGRYSHTAINRAPSGFVLQMGSFLAFPPDPLQWVGLFESIDTLDPVTTDANNDGQADFATLSNTRGTVSLALQANNPNSGTSSFFINIGDNSGLDGQAFVPFAEIQDMTVVDRIMNLTKFDLSGEVGQSGNLAFTDVPITDADRIVVIKSVRVLQADPGFNFVGPVQMALEQIQQQAGLTAAAEISAMASSSAASSAAALPAVGAVPEPSSAALGALAALSLMRRRRRLA